MIHLKTRMQPLQMNGPWQVADVWILLDELLQATRYYQFRRKKASKNKKEPLRPES